MGVVTNEKENNSEEVGEIEVTEILERLDAIEQKLAQKFGDASDRITDLETFCAELVEGIERLHSSHGKRFGIRLLDKGEYFGVEVN